MSDQRAEALRLLAEGLYEFGPAGKEYWLRVHHFLKDACRTVRWFNVERLHAAEVSPWMREPARYFWEDGVYYDCPALRNGFARVTWNGELWIIDPPLWPCQFAMVNLVRQVNTWPAPLEL